jgi:hypothetical protein
MATLIHSEDNSQDLLSSAGRVTHTYHLARQLTGLSAKDLLRNPQNGEVVTNPKEQNKVIAHNLLLRLVPEAFSDPVKYQNALDLYYAVLLDGDLKAKHLWHYYDDRVKGWWTPGSGAAARAWYGLSVNSVGELQPDELPAKMATALQLPNWLDAIRHAPSATLARSIDLPDRLLSPRVPLLEQPVVQKYITAIAPLEIAMNNETAVRLQNVDELAGAAGLGDTEKKALMQAAALLPSWSQQIDIRPDCPSDAGSILREISVSQSTEGLPVVQASGKLSKILADGWQGWMASSWCDLVAEEIRQRSGHRDDLSWLERTRTLCSRSPWQSPQGRKMLRPEARRQESRLRKITLDLLSSPPKPSKAPARQPDLQAV